MRGFHGKARAAAAFVRLGARRRVMPADVSGLHAYLPELKAILAESQQRLVSGKPLRLPQAQLAEGRVSLITLEAFELIESGIYDAEVATSVRAEIAERRRAMKRDGFDSLLRAALIQKYGLRIERRT